MWITSKEARDHYNFKRVSRAVAFSLSMLALGVIIPSLPEIANKVRTATPAAYAKMYYTLFVPKTYFVRNGGGTTVQCTGLANVDYDGSGSGEACAFSSVPTAITAATFGDTIKLAAGQTFSTPPNDTDGEWALPDKGTPPTNTDADYITITTTDESGTPSALLGYPATRTRITDAMAVNMPKVVAEGATPLWRLAQGSEYWRIERLQWTNDSTNGWQTIVFFDNGPITSLANVPHHIEIRYNWIHPDEETGTALSPSNDDRSAENAIYINAANVNIHHNAMQGFVGLNRYGGEVGRRIASSNVLITTYATNVTIEHNLLEGWTYAFFTGGSSMPDWTVTSGGTVVSCSSPTVCTFSNVTNLAEGDPVSGRVFEPTPITKTDGAITSGTRTVTSATGTFTGGDFDKKIVVYGAGPGGTNLEAKIQVINSATSVDITELASTTVSGATVRYGERTWGAAFVTDITGSVVTFSAPLCHSYDGGNTCATLTGNPTPAAGDPLRWRGLQPNNILVRRNLFAHYPEWADITDAVNGDTGDCGGKGYLEVKSCVDCDFIGNVFTGCTGPTVTVRNQDGDFAWASLDGLTFESNVWENSNRVFTSFFSDSTPTPVTQNVAWINNLVLGLTGNVPAGQVGGELSAATRGGLNVTFSHNTIAWNKANTAGMTLTGWHAFVSTEFKKTFNLVFRNNIFAVGDNQCFDSGVQSDCWPDATITHNVFVNVESFSNAELNSKWFTSFPTDPTNFLVTSYTPVGFVNPNTNLTITGADYRLSVASPYKNAASDGTDIGYSHTKLVTDMGFDIYSGAPAPSFTTCRWSSSPPCQ